MIVKILLQFYNLLAFIFTLIIIDFHHQIEYKSSYSMIGSVGYQISERF